jgi:chromosomal replication initiation ATPase DnaA
MQLLEQLDAYALQTQRAITIPLIKAMLDEHPPVSPSAPSPLSSNRCANV